MKPEQTSEYLDELKRRLQKKYPQLTKDDLITKRNNEGEMLTMVAYKLRKTKAEIQEILKGL